MGRAGRYVVTYDIPDDRLRAGMARLLEGYGFRVQKSVFECLLTRGMRERLMGRLGKMTIQDGSVFVYRLDGISKKASFGLRPDRDPDAGCAFIA